VVQHGDWLGSILWIRFRGNIRVTWPLLCPYIADSDPPFDVRFGNDSDRWAGGAGPLPCKALPRNTSFEPKLVEPGGSKVTTSSLGRLAHTSGPQTVLWPHPQVRAQATMMRGHRRSRTQAAPGCWLTWYRAPQVPRSCGQTGFLCVAAACTLPRRHQRWECPPPIGRHHLLLQQSNSPWLRPWLRCGIKTRP
jgi:hypothetical protein